MTYWRSVGLRTMGALTVAMTFLALLSYALATGLGGRTDEEVWRSDWPLYLAASLAVAGSAFVLVRQRSMWKIVRYSLGVVAMISIPIFVDMVVVSPMQVPVMWALIAGALLVPLKGDVMASRVG